MTTLNDLKGSTNVIKLTVPMFIRLLEWAREEAKDDVVIHTLTDKIVDMNRVLTSEDYSELF